MVSYPAYLYFSVQLTADTINNHYPVLVPTTGSLSLLVRGTRPVMSSSLAIFLQYLLSQSLAMPDSCLSTNLNSPGESSQLTDD